MFYIKKCIGCRHLPRLIDRTLVYRTLALRCRSQLTIPRSAPQGFVQQTQVQDHYHGRHVLKTQLRCTRSTAQRML